MEASAAGHEHAVGKGILIYTLASSIPGRKGASLRKSPIQAKVSCHLVPFHPSLGVVLPRRQLEPNNYQITANNTALFAPLTGSLSLSRSPPCVRCVRWQALLVRLP